MLKFELRFKTMRSVFEQGILFEKGGRRSSDRFKRIALALGWRQKYENKPEYVLELDSGKVLNIIQIPNGEVNGIGTGAHVWPAAHILAKYLEKRYGLGGLAGKEVIDLGSGTGVLAIVAASLGAVNSTATDVESTLSLMKSNCERAKAVLGLNDGSSENEGRHDGCLNVASFDWNGSTTDLPTPTPDIVLVSDCILPQLYEIEPLVNALNSLLVKEGAVAFVSYEHRPYPHYHPRQRFEELLSTRGLAMETIPQEQQHEIYVSDEVELLRVFKTRPGTL